jgi:hypothetical protein
MRNALLLALLAVLLAGCVDIDGLTNSSGNGVYANGSENVFEDDYLRVEFPDWEQGPIVNANDFFIMSHDEKRSYVLNYDSEAPTPEEVVGYYAVGCSQDEACTPIMPPAMLPEGNVEYAAFCFANMNEELGEVEQCVAASSCGGKVFYVSSLQEKSVKSLPLNEFEDVLKSTNCKKAGLLPL